MDYGYWLPDGSKKPPAQREVEKSLKDDKPAKRKFDLLLDDFEGKAHGLMVSLGDIVPFRNSPTKLQEWRVAFPNNRIGRMMFVITRDGKAAFLHFFIKKSHKGAQTPPKNANIAEKRAKQFRQNEQYENIVK
jgi:phage-related protein